MTNVSKSVQGDVFRVNGTGMFTRKGQRFFDLGGFVIPDGASLRFTDETGTILDNPAEPKVVKVVYDPDLPDGAAHSLQACVYGMHMSHDHVRPDAWTHICGRVDRPSPDEFAIYARDVSSETLPKDKQGMFADIERGSVFGTLYRPGEKHSNPRLKRTSFEGYYLPIEVETAYFAPQYDNRYRKEHSGFTNEEQRQIMHERMYGLENADAVRTAFKGCMNFDPRTNPEADPTTVFHYDHPDRRRHLVIRHSPVENYDDPCNKPSRVEVYEWTDKPENITALYFARGDMSLGVCKNEQMLEEYIKRTYKGMSLNHVERPSWEMEVVDSFRSKLMSTMQNDVPFPDAGPISPDVLAKYGTHRFTTLEEHRAKMQAAAAQQSEDEGPDY